MGLAGGAGEAAIPTRLFIDEIPGFALGTADFHLPVLGSSGGSMPRFTPPASIARAVPGGLLRELRVAQSGTEVEAGFNDPAGGLLLYGGAGDDLLEGSSANDFISAVHGDDRLDGGPGDDRMIGGPGDDVFHVDSLLDMAVESSGEGSDTVRVTVGDYRLHANVEQAILEGIANLRLFGNSADNALVGNGGLNELDGLEGNDKLYGGGGNDTLFGRDGADLLAGQDGDDRLDGGAGDDRMIGGAGSDTYFVDSFFDMISEKPGEGDDTAQLSIQVPVGTYELPDEVEHGILLGSNHLGLFGNAAANSLTGNSGNNRLGGLEGDDVLDGGGGNDELYGFYGNDRLYGGDGDDWLLGYHGADLLSGGAGNDVFAFWEPLDSSPQSADEITDFESAAGASDRIDLSVMDANSTLAGDQAFALSARAAPFSVWYEWKGVQVIISADVNGDAVADFTLQVMCGGVFFTEDLVL